LAPAERAGKRIRFGPTSNQTPWHTIIGVVGDVKNRSLTAEQPPTVYTPAGQMQADYFMVAVRSEVDPATLTSAIRERLTAIHREALITEVRTMQRIMDTVVWQPRLFTILFGVFALIAVLVTAVGVFAVVACSVARRSHELAVRVAVGASAGQVVYMVVAQTLGLAACGVAIGMLCAAALAGVIENHLFDVRASDGITWWSVCALLFAVAAFSSYLPARRATRVDPVIALRQE
jgi:putative ABC transport system permease protein